MIGAGRPGVRPVELYYDRRPGARQRSTRKIDLPGVVPGPHQSSTKKGANKVKVILVTTMKDQWLTVIFADD